VDIGSLGGSSTTAYGINNYGQVVGFSYLSGGSYRAFLYSGGPMTDLGTLPCAVFIPDTTTNSRAYGINNYGQVVGESDTFLIAPSGDPTIVQHAFLWSGGTMSDLTPTVPTDEPSSAAYAINDNGQVVGYMPALVVTNGVSCTPDMAFLYSGGTMTSLGTLSLDNGQASNCTCSIFSCGCGINTHGVVVGYSWDCGLQFPFFYTNGTMTNLLFQGFVPIGNCAYGINGSTNFVGDMMIEIPPSVLPPSGAAVLHAFLFLYTNSTMLDLGTLSAYADAGSIAYGINEYDEVVGSASTSSGTVDAFLYYDHGPMLDLNGLIINRINISLTEARGINDSGQIIANGANGHAYLLTPTPPAPWLVQPNFLSITQTGGTVNFTWSTAVGPTYQVQYNSDLTSTNWNNLGSPSIATNYTMSASDSITDLQRFYRVLMQ